MSEPWTSDERKWALECFRAGDGVGEIAAAAERCFLDTAIALNVYDFVQREVRWRPSVKPDAPGLPPSRWVGGMLKEVAVYRLRLGETRRALANVARVKYYTMAHATVGAVKTRQSQHPSQCPARDAFERAHVAPDARGG